MGESKAKYHHLIPQTYMSAWSNDSGTLMVEYLSNPGIWEQKNKKNIGGMNDYYSIQVGMPICDKNDTDKIFASLTEYTVEINGQVVTDTLEMNNKFNDFDTWVIKRKDGSTVSKKHIRHEITKVKIKDIESKWSTIYENKWNDVIYDLKTSICTSEFKSIDAIHKEYLMEFFVALDWRSFQSNCEFQKVVLDSTTILRKIEIPKEDRRLPMLDNASEEIRYYLLLKYYRKYFDKKGIMYENVRVYLANMSLTFLVADGQETFITSDNPAFMFKRNDNKIQGVCRYNDEIKKNASRFIIKENKY